MKKRVLIEDSLTEVSQYLSKKGLNVSNLNKNNLNSCDVIVVSGQDSNIMGISNIEIEKPVINARGKTSDDIYNQIVETLK
ncbi:YkuS family protein [Abyssisolibacter fermentans]|uniref:YkuS family protein n=1 Tax=Abyssisolibacter fermentans TaxID=1766203 RepID=UPI00083148FD|nr:YkuS family protein [Abyssisolibacter fermentans]